MPFCYRLVWCVVLVVIVDRGEPLVAQSPVSAYVAVAIGVGDQQRRIAAPTGHSSVSSSNILGTAAAGLILGKGLAVDAMFRTTLGFTEMTPFRAVSVGPTFHLGGRPSVHLRAGFGRIRGSDTIVCIDNSRSCPDFVHEWSSGLDLSVSAEFRVAGRTSVGPSVWWVQSIEGGTRHRSLGVGVQVRFQ